MGGFGEGGLGVLRRREGVWFVYDFYVLLTIPLVGISLLGGFFSPFLFFFLSREGRFVSSYFFSCFLPFSFLSLFLFCLFSFPDENHQRLKSGAIPSKPMSWIHKGHDSFAYSCYVRIAFTLLFICRELAF